MSVYRRAGTRFFWIEYSAHGRRYQVSAKTANRREAEQRERDLLRSIELGTWAPPEGQGQSRPTVETYAETWIARRRAAGIVIAKTEETRLRAYVLPVLGVIALEDLRRPQIAAWMRSLETHVSERTRRPLAPRTVGHIYATLRTLLADAVADGLIATTPATLTRRKGELPKLRDADPRWREGAIYTRTELEALVGDRALPIDRRVYYALLGLAGLRSSEAAGVRWRDYDARTAPLGRLLVATQITASRVERETKTALPRRVPVHPVLAELLELWRRDGWPQFFGRHPTDGDLIVPSRVGGRGLEARSGSKARERLLEDLELLGFRSEGRARHALRATFVTLATEDGAIPSILDLVVWAKPGAVRAGYQRFPWAALCAEVAKLRVELRSPLVVTLGRGARGLSLDPDSAPDSRPNPGGSVGETNRGGGIRNLARARSDSGTSGNRRDPAGSPPPEIPARGEVQTQPSMQSPDSARSEAARLLSEVLGRPDLAALLDDATAARRRSW